MNLSFFDRLRPFLSRVIAPIVASGTGYVMHKTGIAIDDQSVTSAVVIGVYGIVHKLLDKKLNPDDSASAHLAVQGQKDLNVINGTR